MRLNRRQLRRALKEGITKEMYGVLQNKVYSMAQSNGHGYICHLCVSQVLRSNPDIALGLNPESMHDCCQVIEDMIASGMLQPGPCKMFPLVTVYYAL